MAKATLQMPNTLTKAKQQKCVSSMIQQLLPDQLLNNQIL